MKLILTGDITPAVICLGINKAHLGREVLGLLLPACVRKICYF